MVHRLISRLLWLDSTVLKCRHYLRGEKIFYAINRNYSMSDRSGESTKKRDLSAFDYICPIPEESFEAVIVHLRCNFFRHEVMNKAVSISEEGEPHELLETHCLKTLKENLSVMALHSSSDEIAAVSLNGIAKNGDIEKDMETLKTVTDEKYKLIFTLLNKFNLSCNIFEREQVDELFDCKVVSVDDKFRGKGLSEKLVELSEEIAKKEGFKVMKADVTGAFSQKVFEKRGFEVVFEKKYTEITDENGEQLLKTDPPHEYFKIIIKRLDE